MQTLYKLTTQDYKTRVGYDNVTTWGESVTHYASGDGPLCSKAWLHAYLSPDLAIMLNPLHAGIKNPILWEAKGEVGKKHGILKVGCTELTTIRIIEPTITNMEQRISFAILSAKKVFFDPTWNKWADEWLNGHDRSKDSAYSAGFSAGFSAAAFSRSTSDATSSYAYSAADAASVAAYSSNSAYYAASAVTYAYAYLYPD